MHLCCLFLKKVDVFLNLHWGNLKHDCVLNPKPHIFHFAVVSLCVTSHLGLKKQEYWPNILYELILSTEKGLAYSPHVH